MNTKAIIEGIKEVARLAFFGAISAAISWGLTKVTALPADSVYAIAGTVVLRFLDSYIHNNENIKLNGISPV